MHVDGGRLQKMGDVFIVADVQLYVLCYWEPEFRPRAPNKSGGGQRLYTQHDLDIILRIKQLLYSEGFTIAGAKKKLEGEGAEPDASPTPSSKDLTKPFINVRKHLAPILHIPTE